MHPPLSLYPLSTCSTNHQRDRPNTNGCQFFITTQPAEFLDGKHTVFGEVYDQDGMLILRKIENVPTGANNRPKLAVKVVGQFMFFFFRSTLV